MNRESNEKVRIRVRLTEEENQKLEHDSACAVCLKANMSASFAVVSAQSRSHRRCSGR
ncbi:MAG: hypothetical protein ACLTDC_10510 [Lachnospiraceae bacterium]